MRTDWMRICLAQGAGAVLLVGSMAIATAAHGQTVGQAEFQTAAWPRWGRATVPCPPAPCPGTYPVIPEPALRHAPQPPTPPASPGAVTPAPQPPAGEQPVLPAPTSPTEAAQAPAPAPAPAPPPAPPTNALAGTFGGSRGMFGAPNMIGDFFGDVHCRSLVPQDYRVSGVIQGFDGAARFASSGQGPITLHAMETLTLDGANFTVNPWQSATDQPNPASFAVVPDPQLGPAQELALANQFQGATGATRAGAQATQIDGDPLYYNIFADYLIEGVAAPDPVVLCVPTPTQRVGRMKIAENSNPLPQDRFIFNYNFYDDVPLWADGISVHRFTSGVEKTFADGMASVEVRVPMLLSLDSEIYQDGGTDLSDAQWGNIALTTKVILLQRRNWALTGGLTATLPTADNTRVYTDSGLEVVRIENESYHIMPFLGYLWMPTERFYFQTFLQYDVDPTGNPVYVNRTFRPGVLDAVGEIRDTAFQYVDLAAGYRVFRNTNPHRYLDAVWLTSEVHWNASMGDPDYVVSGNTVIGDPTVTDIDIVDMLVGSHFQLGRATVTTAYGFPVGNGADNAFDGEFRLSLDYYYGRSLAPYARR